MEERKIPAAVVDASFMAAYFLGLFTGKETSHEQGFSKARDAISAIVLQNGQLFVPNIFFYEMGNILHTAAHIRFGARKRSTYRKCTKAHISKNLKKGHAL